MTIDALAQFARCIDAMTRQDEMRLVAAGVRREILYSGASVVGVVEADTSDSSGTWQPCPDSGRRLYVVPCGARGIGGILWLNLCDLLAFELSRPLRWWLRYGVAAVLNAEAFQRAEHFQTPLHLHHSPLSWLQRGATGALVLDWRGLDVGLWFGGLDRVLCDSWSLRSRLASALKPSVPEIRVRTTPNAAGGRYGT